MSVVRLTGKDAAFKVGGTVFNKCRRWEFNPQYRFVDGSAAGDPMEANQPIRGRYEARVVALFDDAEPYVTKIALVGTALAWAGLLKSTHVNGLVGATGFLSEAPITVPEGDMVEITLTFIPDGTAVTVDESPTT